VRRSRARLRALPRAFAVAAVLVAAAGLAACGSSGGSGPAATTIATETPLVKPTDPVQSNLAAPKPDPVSGPGTPVRGRPAQFGTDNDEVSVTAGKPLDPCTLVSTKQARAIVGGRVVRRLAPQGPTCVYVPRSARRLVTVAVEHEPVSHAARTSRSSIRVRIGGRPAYCVNAGTVAMLVPLSRGRVLRVAAACPIAAKFATAALPGLLRG
jgi:hypothetical protein